MVSDVASSLPTPTLERGNEPSRAPSRHMHRRSVRHQPQLPSNRQRGRVLPGRAVQWSPPYLPHRPGPPGHRLRRMPPPRRSSLAHLCANSASYGLDRTCSTDSFSATASPRKANSGSRMSPALRSCRNRHTLPSAVRPRKNRGAFLPPGSLTLPIRPWASWVNRASACMRISSRSLTLLWSAPVRSLGFPMHRDKPSNL